MNGQSQHLHLKDTGNNSYFNGRFTNRVNGKEGFCPDWSWSEATLRSGFMIPQSQFILRLSFFPFLKKLFSLFFFCPLSWEWQQGIQFVTLTVCPVASSVTPSPTINYLWACPSDSAGSYKCPCSQSLRHCFNAIGYYRRDLGCACFSCFLYSLPPVPSWILTQSL